MTLGSMKTTAAAAALLACFVGTAIVKAQQATETPLLSDQVFKNVQVMKGIPVDQFMATMGFFSASLGTFLGRAVDAAFARMQSN